MGAQNTMKNWLDEEAAMRRKAAPAGVANLEQLRGSTGLEILQKVGGGELPPPPIAELIDFVPIEVEHGRIVFQGTPGWQHYNPSGVVHGGYAATLLDTAVGGAIQSTLAAGIGFTTLELKVNYVRPMTEKTGPVRAEGKVISTGKQVAIAEGRIVDAVGRLYAHATTTCMVFPI
jgi:uncharacterized protein (TIGR00369 family)